MAASKLQAFWNHPAGPKTIFFWAPTFKWGISIANVSDFSKPTEELSYPQQAVITCTGLVWARYSIVITPINWNLFFNSIALASTGIYQLVRKMQHDFSSSEGTALAKERYRKFLFSTSCVLSVIELTSLPHCLENFVDL